MSQKSRHFRIFIVLAYLLFVFILSSVGYELGYVVNSLPAFEFPFRLSWTDWLALSIISFVLSTLCVCTAFFSNVIDTIDRKTRIQAITLFTLLTVIEAFLLALWRI